MSKDDPLANIMSELEGGSRIAVPKRRVVSLPKPLVAPRGVVGAGLGTGNMNPRGDMSRRLLVDDGGVGLGQIESVRAQGQFMDEVDAYLEQKARASREAGGDEFYTRVQMKHQATQALVQEAAYSRHNPPSSSNAAFGINATLTAEQSLEVARWTGKDAETTAISIILGPAIALVTPVNQTSQTINPASVAFRPYAVVMWGTSAYMLTAEVDIALGMQFSVHASSAMIRLVNAANVSSSSIGLSLAGMISFGTVFRTQPITRTIVVSLTEPALAETITIPPFAKSFAIYRSSSSVAVEQRVEDYTGSIIYTVNRAGAAQETLVDPVPLTGDSRYIQFASGSAVEFRVIFYLAL